MVWVNSQNVRDLRTPFGGAKESGIGRDGGHHSFDFYCETSTIHSRWASTASRASVLLGSLIAMPHANRQYSVLGPGMSNCWSPISTAARRFYVDLLGFVETARDDALYLRGLEEREHHSLVLRAGRGAGPATSPSASPRRTTWSGWRDGRGAGSAAPRVARRRGGAGAGAPDAGPGGLPLSSTTRWTPAPRLLQQYHLHGPVQIMRLDHFNCQVPDVAPAVAWYQRRAGLPVSSSTPSRRPPDGDELWAAWLHRKHTVHDLALMNGIGPRLHHAGFGLPDALAVLRACDSWPLRATRRD